MARPALLVDAGALIALVNNRDRTDFEIYRANAGWRLEILPERQ